MKIRLTVTLDEKVVERIDDLSKKLVDGNRSQMIENLLSVALMDAKLLQRIGLVELAKVVRMAQGKMGQELLDFRKKALA